MTAAAAVEPQGRRRRRQRRWRRGETSLAYPAGLSADDEVVALARDLDAFRRNQRLRTRVRHQVLVREFVGHLRQALRQRAGGEDVVVAAAGFAGTLRED